MWTTAQSTETAAFSPSMLPRCAAVLICAGIAASCALQAQSAKPLQWDITSVKPISPESCPANSGGVGYLPDGITASCVPIAFVVQVAYHLMDQTRILGLPEWTKDPQRLYSIQARVSSEDASAFNQLSRPEKSSMLQPLLAERYHMKAHMEAREIPAYDLVVAKSGSKLKQPSADERATSQFGAPNGNVKWVNAPLTNLTFLLGRETGRPVVDKTNLTGKYDFTLEYAPAARAAADEIGKPSVFTALEEQLGLKLVPSKEPVDVLVIDSIEPPTAN